MKAKQSKELEQYLNGKKIKYDLLSKSGGKVSGDTRNQTQFAAVKRWFQHDWMKIEPKLRTPFVEGISVFLSMITRRCGIRSARRRRSTT